MFTRPAARGAVVLATLLLTGALVVGCSSESNSTGASNSAGSAVASSSGPAVTGTIVVLAAASLTESFTALGRQFEATHPGTTVKFSFGASSTLAQQINQGAPADVFASAATSNMDQVVQAGGAAKADVKNFAANVMEIAVPPSNPQNIQSVSDLGKSGVKVAVCQPQVPCGAKAVELFAKNKVTVTPVTQEQDVKAALGKVEANEVDAGVVYVTDVRSAGTKVKGVAIPADQNVSTEYPIAPLTKAANADGATAFADYVLSDDGQKLLAADGFAKP